MSASNSALDLHLVSVLTSDYSFEILQHLKSDGMTTDELVAKVAGNRKHQAVYAHLEKLRLAGLLFRFRFGVEDQWWANREGVLEAIALLSKSAAMISERNAEEMPN